MFHEVFEQLELTRRELDRLVGLGHFGLAKIHMNIAEAIRVAGRRRRCRLRGHAADQRFDAREQFDHFKRLDQIIVGPQLQTDHFVDDLTARGQHQDRRVDASLSQRPAHIESVAAG